MLLHCDLYATLAQWCDLRTVVRLRSTCKILRRVITEWDVDRALMRGSYSKWELIDLCTSGTRLQVIPKVISRLTECGFFLDKESAASSIVLSSDNVKILQAYPQKRTREIAAWDWRQAFNQGFYKSIRGVLDHLPVDADVTIPFECALLRNTELAFFIIHKFQLAPQACVNTTIYNGNVQVLDSLLKAGASIMPQAVICAINGESEAMIDYLLQKGIDFHSETSPVWQAFLNGAWDLIAFLLDRGIGTADELSRIVNDRHRELWPWLLTRIQERLESL